MVHVSSTMWRIKNLPSKSTSCSDNALCFMVVVADILYWGHQATSSFSIWVAFWKVVLREVYFEGPYYIWRALKTSILNNVGNSPPTLTGVGHQWMESTNIGCNQWLSLAKIALKVPHAGRNRSLVARTNKFGECISDCLPLAWGFYGHFLALQVIGCNEAMLYLFIWPQPLDRATRARKTKMFFGNVSILINYLITICKFSNLHYILYLISPILNCLCSNTNRKLLM